MRTCTHIQSLVFVAAIALCGLLNIRTASAMTPEQLQALAGSALLEMRADALLHQCGLPADIADTGTAAQQTQALRWEGVDMRLSAQDWEITYTRSRAAPRRSHGWRNPAAGGDSCLSGLASLALHAKGGVGILSVKPRADKQGYRTSNTVPKNVFIAHQVTGLTGLWTQGVALAKLQTQYGKPEQVLHEQGGVTVYRYWVVARHKDMPIAVHAVDFIVSGAQKTCFKYAVYTNGNDFVQDKYDALEHMWEVQFYD